MSDKVKKDAQQKVKIMHCKKFMFEAFNAEKLNSRVQTNIFQLFFLTTG